ncbi:MAG: ribokinase [Peptostreptococcus sp.]|uniref:ribokinase n=1 Tax=Peptostreptococcus sp. TaxID=1262 RepID=UPI002FC89BE8
MSKVLVLGSLSTDFVATTDIRPNVGETVQGNSFFTTFGGKGSNQAVAASRLGSDVLMLGKVGDDSFADSIIDNLKKNNVDVSCVESVTHTSSGAAIITISDSDNSIIYVPGANGCVDANYVNKYKKEILTCDIAVAQHEVSEESVEALANICEEGKIPFVLNPAPYRKVKASILEKASYLLPNESECKLLYPDMTIQQAVAKYPNKLLVTMGSQGVFFNDGEKSHLVPTFKVDAVDTTGAGDTFIGGFSTGISNGLSIEESITLANLSASQSVTKMGAQGGMPQLEELKSNKNYKASWNL